MRLSTRIALLSLAAAFAAPATRQLGAQVAAPANDTASVAIPVSIIADTATAVVTDQASATAGSMTGLRAGVHARETARSSAAPTFATGGHIGQSKALMIVGGAALITGAIIGGDVGTIFMVGGAVMGLYGLYQYLQ
jgi:hypothetical protein